MKFPRVLYCIFLVVPLLIMQPESVKAQGAGASGAGAAYYLTQRCHEVVTGDLLKLVPRALGHYIYQNRYDFGRGFTFMIRDINSSPAKLLDYEEIRRNAYTRLMRDIPYCVQAFEGGDIKLDTSHANLANRLGMIVYSIMILKMPATPDVLYLEKLSSAFVLSLVENQFDIFVYFDGYGDFNSLGELMERLEDEGMPQLKHTRNDKYPGIMREDPYAQFRAPLKFERNVVFTDVEMNLTYNIMMNSMVDALTFIWKTSGMELAHPSHMAPPGTAIKRPSRRTALSGGVVQRPKEAIKERERPEGEEEQAKEGEKPPETKPETRPTE